MSAKIFHVTKLNTEFEKRISKNPSYSIRSFARDLDMDSSSLSSIMKGKRNIPSGKIESIANKICTGDAEIELFLKSTSLVQVSLQAIKKETIETRHLIDEHEFANISDVKTYTFLSLLETEGFKWDKDWIGKKLKLDPEIVEQKIQNLLNLGLLKIENELLVRTKKRTSTSDDIACKYIQKHHVDSLELAKEKCLELLPHERYFSTFTIPCDPDSIGHIKQLITEFEDKIEAYLRPNKKKEVFKLSIQFYQATEKDS